MTNRLSLLAVLALAVFAAGCQSQPKRLDMAGVAHISDSTPPFAEDQPDPAAQDQPVAAEPTEELQGPPPPGAPRSKMRSVAHLPAPVDPPPSARVAASSVVSSADFEEVAMDVNLGVRQTDALVRRVKKIEAQVAKIASASSPVATGVIMPVFPSNETDLQRLMRKWRDKNPSAESTLRKMWRERKIDSRDQFLSWFAHQVSDSEFMGWVGNHLPEEDNINP